MPQSGTKMFTVDKFLGLNEAADGETELKMGEASKMENWRITDGFNITLRPGVRRVDMGVSRDPKTILASWSGFVGEDEYFVICDFDGLEDRLWLYTRDGAGSFSLNTSQSGVLGLTAPFNPIVKIFPFGGRLFVMSAVNTVMFNGTEFVPASYYVPIVVTGANPDGGGTTLENLNMLTPYRKIEFSADGEATSYVLPSEATAVTEIIIDNVPQTVSGIGNFIASSHTFIFNSPPIKGVSNVQFTYNTLASDTEESYARIAAMPLWETYNGSTDTRLFVAGDGSNICYYSGTPISGDLTQLYFPGMNEVAVDMSDSPITGMVRHYSKLLVFKPDGTFSITYEPVTLTDGSTIAGFFLRNINKEFGNDVLGQVQTVENYPRTVSHGGIIEWHITTSNYKDERYAERVSDMVSRTMEKADTSRIVTCDDSFSKTYYVFLNDDSGTVLVNRYALNKNGLWTIYRSPVCTGIKSAFMNGNNMVFCNDKEAFWFDDGATTDVPVEAGGEELQIKAVWESGYLSFGADFRRKYSSQIYVSILPEGYSDLKVTAATDRRSEYMEKAIQTDLFSWRTVTFPTWTFSLSTAPKINRVRLKVKKFVYYKLIFKIDVFGATATVLGYDQQVRFSSMAK